ncbi:MAG TPA: flagellin [Chloroflexota bacterium]|jgi:flagellin|nr:flagellin [Chloroflexota bacterium]
MRINHNLFALDAQRNLSLTQMSLSKSVERLSSGLRINRAADDAAGLSISEKLRAQINGLDQASRNAQDAISMIQTGEGGLNEVHSMLQRMRELAVEASNDTLSDADRANINSELQQLLAEINNIANTTQFNGKYLLNGSLVTQLGGTAGSDLVVGDLLATGGNAMVTKIDVSGAKAGDTYTFSSSAAGTITLTRASDNVSQTINVSNMAANASQTLNFSQLGVSVTLQTDAAGKTAADIITDLTAAANDTIVTTGGSSNANYQIGANASDFINVAFVNVGTSGSGVNAAMSALNTALGNFNTTQSVSNAQALITAVDGAITFVNSVRSTLGAYQNRLEHTIANLGVSHENLTASESRIRDADIAEEMANFTRDQILQQAGTAILAQANQVPQGVLTLLR